MARANADLLESYYDLLASDSRWTVKGLKSYNDYLFGDISFEGKRVLDVGAGRGAASFYAAVCGALSVVSLEPEVDGSTPGVRKQFEETAQRLGLDNVTLVSQTLQDFCANDELFDTIISIDSINHLDEWACVNLLRTPEARERYLFILEKLSRLCNSDAEIVITDLSPHNVFPLLGLTNPRAETIEWHKHQPPSVWIRLLREVGFGNPDVRWFVYPRLGRVGRLLFGNRFGAFFLISRFRLRMNKQGP